MSIYVVIEVTLTSSCLGNITTSITVEQTTYTIRLVDEE